jgi:hypothetical protein
MHRRAIRLGQVAPRRSRIRLTSRWYVGLSESSATSSSAACRHRRQRGAESPACQRAAEGDYDPVFLDWIFWLYLATVELTDSLLARLDAG